ncbi:MAG TPA: ribosome maturation factor RimM [Acidimicrobiales bacterium]|nr:ribosome maturation factor RimM [Acidimicrobiales bacterium]
MRRPEGGDRLLEIGHVTKAHGLRGEVVVDLVTNRLERLAAGQRLTARLAGPPSIDTELVVTSSRPFQHRHLVHFDGVVTREGAEALRGAQLLAPPVQDPETLFVHDLIGSEVVDLAGTSHGIVIAVEANPASDLLVGEAGWLVPLRFVVERRGGQLLVDAPEGLFE